MNIPKYYKKSFDRWVPVLYDSIFNLSLLGTAKKFRTNSISQLINPKKVLDMATGTGEFAIAIKKRYPQTKVIGIDLSKEMLNKAKIKAKKEKLDIKFIRGNIENTGFKNNTFDTIIIGFALHEVPEKPRINIIKEAYKLLEKNGTCLIFELNKPKNTIFRFLFKIYLKIVEPDYKRAINFLDYNLENKLDIAKFKYIKTKYYYLHSVKVIACKKM